MDGIYLSRNFRFNFGRSNSNTFKSVKHIGYFDINTTPAYIEATINSWKNGQSWFGVLDSSIGLTLDEMTMDLVDATSRDFFTLPNGERINTFTQVENQEELGRTGYTIRDEEGNLYFYYTTVNEEVNIFFKAETNEPYITILNDDDVSSLRVKELPLGREDIDWFDKSILEDENTYQELKYYDAFSSNKVGAIYRLGYDFTTIDGNTFIDADVVQDGNHISVTPKPEKTDVKVFISDIGLAESLYVTNEENPFIGGDPFILTMPSNGSSLTLSANCETEIAGDLDNLFMKERMKVTLDNDCFITKAAIDGEKSANLEFINNGNISYFEINGQANVINRSIIKEVSLGVCNENNAEEVLKNTTGAYVNNMGKISTFNSFANISFLNSKGGMVENIHISYVKGFEDLSLGSSIINDGSMCTGSGNIYLEVKCSFINTSGATVGKEERMISGGIIYIGDGGLSNAHDGITITNTGFIESGLTEEGESLVFVVYGAPLENSSPEFYIANIGLIINSGETIKLVYDEFSQVFEKAA